MKRLFAFLALLLSAPTLDASAEVYLWPMHGPRRLSSSFGEFREGHFHAGIDLRTFGKVGLPCLAIGNGEVARVKIAPGGYGKALYLRLEDGRTAVYAHVDGFTRAVDSLCYYWRLESGFSWCDLSVQEGAFEFGVGDTVCFSGTTGTAAPHLHFELRDEGGRPYNPLEATYSVEDARPPIISGIAVIPLEAGAAVNGSPGTGYFDFRASGGRSYVIPDTLSIEGRVGFAVSVWDEQGYGRYRMAPLRVKLSIDGEQIYEVVNRLFDYSQTGEIGLEYEVTGDGPANRYLVLYRKKGNTLPFRSGPGAVQAGGIGEGELHRLSEGIHEIEILAVDAAGNESRASLRCLVGRRPEIEVARKLAAASDVIVSSSEPDGTGLRGMLFQSIDEGESWKRIDLEPFGRYFRAFPSSGEQAVFLYRSRGRNGLESERYFSSPAVGAGGRVYCEILPRIDHAGLLVEIICDRLMIDDPPLHLSIQGAADSIIPTRIGPKRYEALIGPGQIEDGTNIFMARGRDHLGRALVKAHAERIFLIDRSGGHSFAIDDTLIVEIVPKRLWSEGLCIVGECAMPGPADGGMAAVSGSFGITFQEDRIQSLRLRCDPGKNVGLFRWSERKGWKCVGVPAMESGEVTISRSGVYAFFRDGIPPDFTTVAMERTEAGSGFFKPVRYYVPVTENGCGVDPYAVSASINGSATVCEWDELRSRLYIPIPSSSPAGPVTLSVEITDRAGNRSAGEYSFVIQ
jgi:hypothetical protein